jgi:Bacterial Ig domain/Outer membrane protein beta-barrel domain
MNMNSQSWWKAGSIAVLTAGLLLAPASRAQKAGLDDGTAGDKPSASDSTAKPGKAAPATQAAKPEQKPAKPPADAHIKPGSDYPRWEWFLGYSYYNGRVGSGVSSYNGNGGSTNIEYNLNHWFGLVADFGGYHTGTIDHVDVDLKQFTYLFGPRLNYRFGDRHPETLFGQLLVGGIHANGSALGTSGSDNAFAMAIGGGFDVGLTKHVALRLGQFEYVLSDYDISGYRPQNNFRLSTGVLFRWGGEKPVAPNRPPSAACYADVSSVTEGSGQSVPIRATASSPDGHSLTYVWSANGGHVEGTTETARWSPGNAAPGTYTITARVDDGHGGTASCSANVRVEPRALRPPTMTCSVDRRSVLAGERVNVTADAASPEGFPLEYTWRSNGGQVSGSGSRVQFDTTGLAPGSYTVSGRVSDGHGGAADCVAGLNVEAPPTPPQAKKLGECVFKKVGSTRVDNVCSRLLDDAVLRLQNDPKGSLVLIGYSDPKKEAKGKVAEERAENAKKYTTKKGGIDPSRVSTREEKGVEGADTANRRVEVFWVPEGAKF